MIQVTKEEAAYLHILFPDVRVVKTRNKRYVPEEEKVLKALPDNGDAVRILAANKSRGGDVY